MIKVCRLNIKENLESNKLEELTKYLSKTIKKEFTEEKIIPIDLRIGKRFFINKEYEYIMNKNLISRLEYFYEIWTLKESYIKAVGMGLSISLNSFNICINDNAIS